MAKKQTLPIERLCVCAVMAAVYFFLSHFLKITIPPNIRITLASLPTILVAVLYGKTAAVVTALVGEFICQALSQYGLTPTTPLWILPPAIRGLMVAIGCDILRKRKPEVPVWKQPIPYGIVLVAAAVITTLVNTGITWLDSIIGHYYTFAYVFGDFVVRLLLGIVTAVIVALLSIPILIALAPLVKKTRRT